MEQTTALTQLHLGYWTTRRYFGEPEWDQQRTIKMFRDPSTLEGGGGWVFSSGRMFWGYPAAILSNLSMEHELKLCCLLCFCDVYAWLILSLFTMSVYCMHVPELYLGLPSVLFCEITLLIWSCLQLFYGIKNKISSTNINYTYIYITKKVHL